ncbi:MAG: carboxypeptidase-like regulatory domain-containing protein [Phycisphaerales bacterium]
MRHGTGIVWLGAAALASACGIGWAAPEATLTGVVKDAAGGPVEGATVIVWYAQPTDRVGVLCPSCYPDCGREVRTDERGMFSFEGVDGAMVYQLMVAENHHEPRESDWVEPGGVVHEVELAARRERPEDPRAVFEGVVRDENGNPVPFAVVEPDMFCFLPDLNGRFTGSSRMDGAEMLAVTDGEGRFSLYAPEAIDAMSVRITAQALAPVKGFKLRTGEGPHEFVMGPGVTIRGRLLDREGSPVGGVTIGAVGTNRLADQFAGKYSVGSDDEGRFELANLPPDEQYAVHGKYDELHEKGVLVPTVVDAGGHGTEISVGDLRLSEGVSLSGQVVTSTGDPLPERSVLILSHAVAWDTLQVDLPEDGRFEVTDLLPGAYDVTPYVPGYGVSERNGSRMFNRLVGRIDKDMSGLVILIEPPQKERPRPPQLNELPLRGIEGTLPGMSSGG